MVGLPQLRYRSSNVICDRNVLFLKINRVYRVTYIYKIHVIN